MFADSPSKRPCMGSAVTVSKGTVFKRMH